MLKLEFKTDSFNSTRLNAISDTADQLVYDMLSFPAQMHVKLSENYPNFPDEWLIKASHDTGHSKRVIPVFLPPPSSMRGLPSQLMLCCCLNITAFPRKNGNLLTLSKNRCACYHGSWTVNKAQHLNIMFLCHNVCRELGFYHSHPNRRAIDQSLPLSKAAIYSK